MIAKTEVWEMATLSAFLLGRAVAGPMVARGRGTLIFTGAMQAATNMISQTSKYD
jgi:hypothetical protein